MVFVFNSTSAFGVHEEWCQTVCASPNDPFFSIPLAAMTLTLLVVAFTRYSCSAPQIQKNNNETLKPQCDYKYQEGKPVSDDDIRAALYDLVLLFVDSLDDLITMMEQNQRYHDACVHHHTQYKTLKRSLLQRVGENSTSNTNDDETDTASTCTTSVESWTPQQEQRAKQVLEERRNSGDAGLISWEKLKELIDSKNPPKYLTEDEQVLFQILGDHQVQNAMSCYR